MGKEFSEQLVHPGPRMSARHLVQSDSGIWGLGAAVGEVGPHVKNKNDIET